MAPRFLDASRLLLVALALAFAGCTDPIYRHDSGADGGADADMPLPHMSEDAGSTDSLSDAGPEGEERDGSPDPLADSGVDGGPSNLTVTGPSRVATGHCVALAVTHATPRPSPLDVTVEHPGFALFADDTCSQELTPATLRFEAGATSMTRGLWVKAELTQGTNVADATLRVDGAAGEASWSTEVRRAAIGVENTAVTTCFLLESGVMECVGDNANRTAGAPFGDPGVEYANGRYVPTPTATVTTGTVRCSQISMANATGCGLANGSVHCWGQNYWGQFGTNPDSDGSSEGVPVPGMGEGVSHVDVGDNHVCAVKAGDVYCWGRNEEHQCSAAADAYVKPSKVEGLPTGALEVAAGATFSCARFGDQSVWCWGDNGSSELGQDASAPVSTPVRVSFASAPTAVTRLAAEYHTACALVDGDVVCWGQGGGLFLNDHAALPRPTLGDVPNLTMLAVGRASACAASSADVYCWGMNFQGGMGTGSSAGTSGPAKVLGLPQGKVEALATDGMAAGQCAVVDGIPYCWGFQEEAQLGIDARLGDQLTPILSTTLDGRAVARVSGGAGFSCMVDDSGVMSCWGVGSNGQLGNGSTWFNDAAFALEPVNVSQDLLTAPVEDIAFGPMFALALADGKVYRWGQDFATEWSQNAAPAEVSMAAGADGQVTRIRAATTHACAIVEGGSAPGVYCWGRNDSGTVVGTASSDAFIREPTRIALPLGQVRDLDTNYDLSCAIVEGDLYCWGHRRETAGPSLMDVGGYHDFEHVVTYQFGNVCAARSNGQLLCFADDPASAVTVGSGFTSLRSSVSHLCALKDEAGEQHVFCWGSNSHGQLGTGNRSMRPSPTRVKGLVGHVSFLDVNDSDQPSTCARDSEGLKCWGNNTRRQFVAVPFTVATPTVIEPWN